MLIKAKNTEGWDTRPCTYRHPMFELNMNRPILDHPSDELWSCVIEPHPSSKMRMTPYRSNCVKHLEHKQINKKIKPEQPTFTLLGPRNPALRDLLLTNRAPRKSINSTKNSSNSVPQPLHQTPRIRQHYHHISITRANTSSTSTTTSTSQSSHGQLKRSSWIYNTALLPWGKRASSR